MRFQDTLRFSLELVLPEKVVRLLEGSRDIRPEEGRSSVLDACAVDPSRSRLLLEQADRARYGGATFGADTITLMTAAVDRILAMQSQTVKKQEISRIIECILSIAEDGERNPERLQQKACAKLENQNAA